MQFTQPCYNKQFFRNISRNMTYEVAISLNLIGFMREKLLKISCVRNGKDNSRAPNLVTRLS